jgi:hypothetical protein
MIRRRFWIRLAIVKHIIEAQGKNIRESERRLRIFFTLAKQTEISRKG